jgi:RND family efflux transporter MFP subunit
LAACSRPDASVNAVAPAPWVRTVAIEGTHTPTLTLSGTVRARHETPVAFQVGGRLLSRHVQAGDAVQAGQRLFVLDPRDAAVAQQSAAAQVAAAEAAWLTAQRELERQQQLVQQGFVSAQTLDRFTLQLRQTQSQLDAARAVAAQARHTLGYTELRAPHDGVIVDVTGEAGQVVSAGASLATLAQTKGRDIEVFLPQPPRGLASAVAYLGADVNAPVTLREAAGAADPQSRTWRARFALPDSASLDVWALGSVVRLQLPTASTGMATSAPTHTSQRVPLAALDERAGGPMVWRVVNGQAEPVPVTVVHLEATHAQIRSPLAVGDRVVALGTHRLTPGMAVQEQAR